ncbi:helix-turn-helix domain-containing protein [Pontibacter populi]|uniref:Helix-turn-helix domain-containing protein n=1 Tax=Pontibacter populi TaxID=890055 RepID=A0ABV1RY42_9BACT
MNVQAQDDESLLVQAAKFIQNTACFKEKTIMVHSLAARLGIPAYKLSLALNTIAKTSFNDFINQYRIAYLKTQLEKEEFLQSYTMEALALQASFASRSGFYKAFKKWRASAPKSTLLLQKLYFKYIIWYLD